jgi:hypothetical protein
MEVRHTVVPIFGESQQGEPCPVGSGVLVAAAGRKWIVTAAHVLDEAEFGNLYLGGKRDLLILEGEFFRSSPPPTGRIDDLIDMGYICVDSLSDALSKDFGFLPESLIETTHETEEGKNYLFTGYPHKGVKLKKPERKISPLLHSFESRGIELHRYRTMGLDPRIHISIDFDSRQAKNRNGRLETPKDQRGTSGGGVWIGVPGTGAAHDVSPRLVGLVVEHRSREKALVATKIGPLISKIRESE